MSYVWLSIAGVAAPDRLLIGLLSAGAPGPVSDMDPSYTSTVRTNPIDSSMAIHLWFSIHGATYGLSSGGRGALQFDIERWGCY